jgi:hypothetical protein
VSWLMEGRYPTQSRPTPGAGSDRFTSLTRSDDVWSFWMVWGPREGYSQAEEV